VVLTAPAGPDFETWLRCPRCRALVERESDAYRCTACGHRYPIVLGIPDFRLYEDPLIPLEDDYRKGEKLQREAERRSFADLVAYYWTLPTYPPTPPDLSARFVHHVLTDDRRIESYQHLLDPAETFLDVGCGAGVLVRAAQRRFRTAVGLDVGFRWLIVARRGLEEAGLPARLVCGCADHLPFADATFDTVASVALLEHVPDAPTALKEFARVRRPSGQVVVWTSNRFSLAPEPHVRIWGVGFLPRRWMPAYVKWRRGLAYEKKRLLSRFELARGCRAADLASVRFHLPAIAAADLERAGRLERAAARAYAALRRVPLVRSLIVVVFPVLVAVARGRRARTAA
jgi:ubiquinone/menaquinone biosynthesis C-methylase UbiE